MQSTYTGLIIGMTGLSPDCLIPSPEVMCCFFVSVLRGTGAAHIRVRQCLANKEGRLDHRNTYITTQQLHIHFFLFLL